MRSPIVEIAIQIYAKEASAKKGQLEDEIIEYFFMEHQPEIWKQAKKKHQKTKKKKEK